MLQIKFSSGKCATYRRSGFKSPREWSPGTKSVELPRRSSATFPMRDIMRMLATTYALSVTSTPTRLCGEAAGPRMYGTTYIVRPFIDPSNKAPMVSFASAGAIQLLVGPASLLSREQINVIFSVRATSLGSLRWRKQFGYDFSFRGNV